MPSKLAADILEYTEKVQRLDTPEAVLNTLDGISWPLGRAHVLGAALLPMKFGSTDSLVVGKAVFCRRRRYCRELHALFPGSFLCDYKIAKAGSAVYRPARQGSLSHGARTFCATLVIPGPAN